MAKVTTGGYNLTTTGEDLSSTPCKAPSMDPKLVRRLMKGNAQGGEDIYVRYGNRAKASKYLRDSSLTPTEYRVKQMLDLGIGVLDTPSEDITPISEDTKIVGSGSEPTLGEAAIAISTVTKANSNSQALTTGQVSNAIRSLIAKGYITATKV